MTDRARELLERVIAETDSSHFYSSEIDKEIRAYLADTNPSETINSQEVDRSEQDKLLDFCDTHCTWIDHHPDCPLKAKYRVEGKK